MAQEKENSPKEDSPVYKHRIRGYFEWNGIPTCFLHRDDKLKLIEDFHFEKDDLLICGYPKSGNHFISDICFNIMEEVGQPFIDCRMYSLELGFINEEVMNSSPKMVFSHLPWRLLPKQAREGKVKIVSVRRDPKDVCCSFYPFLMAPVHEGHSVIAPDTTMDDFVELFTGKNVLYGGLFDWLKSYNAHQDTEHFLSLHYEDMLHDLRSTVLKLSAHLDVSLTDEQVEKVVSKNTFKNRKQELRYPFDRAVLRKGEAGVWKNELTEEQIKKLDDWISKSMKDLIDK